MTRVKSSSETPSPSDFTYLVNDVHTQVKLVAKSTKENMSFRAVKESLAHV